jgi:hypothetical protein
MHVQDSEFSKSLHPIMRKSLPNTIDWTDFLCAIECLGLIVWYLNLVLRFATEERCTDSVKYLSLVEFDTKRRNLMKMPGRIHIRGFRGRAHSVRQDIDKEKSI